jgi:hypothetical protein
VRSSLEIDFKTVEGLSSDLFRKRTDRIIWELAGFVSFDVIENSVKAILTGNAFSNFIQGT